MTRYSYLLDVIEGRKSPIFFFWVFGIVGLIILKSFQFLFFGSLGYGSDSILILKTIMILIAFYMIIVASATFIPLLTNRNKKIFDIFTMIVSLLLSSIFIGEAYGLIFKSSLEKLALYDIKREFDQADNGYPIQHDEFTIELGHKIDVENRELIHYFEVTDQGEFDNLYLPEQSSKELETICNNQDVKIILDLPFETIKYNYKSPDYSEKSIIITKKICGY